MQPRRPAHLRRNPPPAPRARRRPASTPDAGRTSRRQAAAQPVLHLETERERRKLPRRAAPQACRSPRCPASRPDADRTSPAQRTATQPAPRQRQALPRRNPQPGNPAHRRPASTPGDGRTSRQHPAARAAGHSRTARDRQAAGRPQARLRRNPPPMHRVHRRPASRPDAARTSPAPREAVRVPVRRRARVPAARRLPRPSSSRVAAPAGQRGAAAPATARCRLWRPEAAMAGRPRRRYRTAATDSRQRPAHLAPALRASMTDASRAGCSPAKPVRPAEGRAWTATPDASRPARAQPRERSLHSAALRPLPRAGETRPAQAAPHAGHAPPAR